MKIDTARSLIKEQNSIKSLSVAVQTGPNTEEDINLASNYLFLQQSMGEGLFFENDPSVTCIPRQLKS